MQRLYVVIQLEMGYDRSGCCRYKECKNHALMAGVPAKESVGYVNAEMFLEKI